MADINPNEKQALETPLYPLIEKAWIKYDSDFKSLSIQDNDILRYALWCIEGLKDNSGDKDGFCRNMRFHLFRRIRDKYQQTITAEEKDELTNLIIAFALECLEWAQTENWPKFMPLFNKVKSSIVAEYREDILSYKNYINSIAFRDHLGGSLKPWIVDYLLNDVFYTDEDAEWMADEVDVIPLQQTVEPEHDFGMTPERWVELYGNEIKTKFIEKKYLISKIQKLRQEYLNEIIGSSLGRTKFLRNHFFQPKSEWLKNPDSFPSKAIQEMFNDKKFTVSMVSKAKKALT